MNDMQRILVVDDTRSILSAVQAALVEATGLPVDIAATLAEARELLVEHAGAYGAAVVDFHLPDSEDGEAVDHMLGHGIPVVVLTGDLNEKVRDEISARPVVDYVVKQGPNAIDAINVVCRDVVRLQRNIGRKVLIVEGSESSASYLHDMLAPQGLTLLKASGPEEALAIVDQHSDIALALIDCQTPRVDGTVLANALRSRFPSTSMAIVGVSRSTDPFMAVKFLKAGADDLVRKPFLAEELVSRVNSCLDNLDNIATIADQANYDYLTQLYSRRYLFELGDKLFKNAERQHIRLTVAIIDIDHFRLINDTWGNQTGDAILKSVAGELKRSLRGGDLIARIGGEEFCILAVNVDEPLNFIEQLRLRIEALEIEAQDQKIRVTISAGIASRLGATLDATLREADGALYSAKERGRNRTVVSSLAII